MSNSQYAAELITGEDLDTGWIHDLVLLPFRGLVKSFYDVVNPKTGRLVGIYNTDQGWLASDYDGGLEPFTLYCLR